jgi:hypothetical protein
MKHNKLEILLAVSVMCSCHPRLIRSQYDIYKASQRIIRPNSNATRCKSCHNTSPAAFPSFQDNDQQNQNNDQDQYDSQLNIILRFPRHMSQILPCLIQSRLVSINMSIDIIQHLYMLVQLIADLDAQLPLSPNRLAQSIQRLVLLSYDLRVVSMNLLVVQMRLIGWTGRWVVSVGKECIPRFFLFLHGRRVGEADGLWGCG